MNQSTHHGIPRVNRWTGGQSSILYYSILFYTSSVPVYIVLRRSFIVYIVYGANQVATTTKVPKLHSFHSFVQLLLSLHIIPSYSSEYSRTFPFAFRKLRLLVNRPIKSVVVCCHLPIAATSIILSCHPLSLTSE